MSTVVTTHSFHPMSLTSKCNIESDSSNSAVECDSPPKEVLSKYSSPLPPGSSPLSARRASSQYPQRERQANPVSVTAKPRGSTVDPAAQTTSDAAVPNKKPVFSPLSPRAMAAVTNTFVAVPSASEETAATPNVKTPLPTILTPPKNAIRRLSRALENQPQLLTKAHTEDDLPSRATEGGKRTTPAVVQARLRQQHRAVSGAAGDLRNQSFGSISSCTDSGSVASANSLMPIAEEQREDSTGSSPKAIRARANFMANRRTYAQSDFFCHHSASSSSMDNLYTNTRRTASLPFFRQVIDQWHCQSAENPHTYGENGYMRVKPGCVIHDRYVLIKKLGWGAFSTVWLSYDTKYSHLVQPTPTSGASSHPFVAVKIGRSSRGKTNRSPANDMLYEIDLLHFLGARLSATNPSTYILDSFTVESEQQRHTCTVMPVHGSNLLSIVDYMKGRKKERRTQEELQLVKDVLASTLTGLNYLSEINVIHTDIKPENVLAASADPKLLRTMNNFLKANQSRCSIPAGQAELYVRPPSAESHTICLADFGLSVVLEPPNTFARNVSPTADGPTAADPQVDLHALLGRLAAAKPHFPVRRRGVMSNAEVGALIQTREYRAPEVLLGLNFNCQTDVWSVGCLAFELITGEFLMDPKRYSTTDRQMDAVHLAMMMQLLGEMPTELTAQRLHFRDYYAARDGGVRPSVEALVKAGFTPPPIYLHRFLGPTGEFLFPELRAHFPPRALQEELSVMMEPEEAVLAADFILRCLTSFDPEQRPSAAEMLQHPWLQYGCKLE